MTVRPESAFAWPSLRRTALALALLSTALSGCGTLVGTMIMAGGPGLPVQRLQAKENVTLAMDTLSLDGDVLDTPVVVRPESSSRHLIAGRYRAIAGSLKVSCNEAYVFAYQGTLPDDTEVDLTLQMHAHIVLDLASDQRKSLSEQFCPKLRELQAEQAAKPLR